MFMTTAPNANGVHIPPTDHWEAATLVCIRAKLETISQHGKLRRMPAAVEMLW